MPDLPDYYDDEFRDYVLARIHPLILHDLWQKFVKVPEKRTGPPITKAEADKLWNLIKKGHLKNLDIKAKEE